MENSLKMLILAASVSITCMVVSVGFYAARQASDISAITNEKLSDIAITIAEDEFMIYDNLVVRGSDVVNFIYRNLSSHSNRTNAPIYVYVDTGSSKTQYEDNIWIDQTKDLSSIYYIHPLRKFKGKVVRNTNDVIIGVSFIAD